MKVKDLDLGLALAAVARGYTVKKRENDNISLKLHNGFIYEKRAKGKNCRIENSALWLDWSSECWYVVGDDHTWMHRPIQK